MLPLDSKILQLLGAPNYSSSPPTPVDPRSLLLKSPGKIAPDSLDLRGLLGEPHGMLSDKERHYGGQAPVNGTLPIFLKFLQGAFGSR